MKILILTGSPRRKGNSAYLAERFAAGAEAAGHDVVTFDTARADIHPCLACNHCGMDGPCVYSDEFTTELRPRLLEADVVVFATPMYYFGISAQLKAAIDRFYAVNQTLRSQPKRAVLLLTYADPGMEESAALRAQYDTLLHYLHWQDAGRVVAPKVWEAGDVRKTPYGDEAYRLGLGL